MSTETSCHRPFATRLKKKALWSLIPYNFVIILYMYIVPGQGLTTPWGQKFDVNRNVLSFRSSDASLKTISLKSDFIQFFFHDYMHIALGQGRQPPGDKILMSTERPYHFTHLLQVSKRSLWSLILYNFFHDLIHVYTPGQGGIQTPGDKVLKSTETSCHLLLVSNHRWQ